MCSQYVPATAVSFACTCAPQTSLQRRKGRAGSKSKPGSDGSSAFPWSTAGTGQAMAGFPILPSPACFFQGTLPTFQHTRTELHMRELMLPWTVLSLQKDILKTSSIALTTLPPSRLRLWLLASTMDRPARLFPQLHPGWGLAEELDTLPAQLSRHRSSKHSYLEGEKPRPHA